MATSSKGARVAASEPRAPRRPKTAKAKVSAPKVVPAAALDAAPAVAKAAVRARKPAPAKAAVPRPSRKPPARAAAKIRPAAAGVTPDAAAAAPKAAAGGAEARKSKVAADDLGGLVSQAADNTLAFNPLMGLRPQDMLDAARALSQIMTASPGLASQSYAQYLGELLEVLKGDSELAPDPKDRRFADPAWKTNPLYRRLSQVYLATQKGLGGYIDGSELSSIQKGRARFFASLVTDALAPSNWLLGNPQSVRKILETGGTHLVEGAKNMLHDAQHNRMLPAQVDTTPFKLGENVATSPGEVVLRHEMFELIQYKPTTPQVHQRPLVMAPPQVNKFYAVDLSPDKSLVKWTTDSGVQMFVMSWRNPTVEQRDWGLEHYVKAIDAAVDAAREITGSPDVNLWGSCSGGMTAAAYLGWLAGRGEHKVANTTWAVCILDTDASFEDSTLGLFNTPATIRAAQERSRRKGIVDGMEMASMFAWLRPNDLIWNYWVNNYLLGNKPPAYDILAWNADTTRLPGQYHCDLLDMMAKNPYVNAGTLEIDGVPIDIGQVKVNAYVVGGITDHITPWKGCYGTARLFGPKTTFVLANAGHLQSLINPPGGSKSYFFAAPAAYADPAEWAQHAQSTRQEGSWWPHWRQWMQAHSGKQVAAPAKLGSRKFKPVGPSPGTYVFEP